MMNGTSALGAPPVPRSAGGSQQTVPQAPTPAPATFPSTDDVFAEGPAAAQMPPGPWGTWMTSQPPSRVALPPTFDFASPGLQALPQDVPPPQGAPRVYWTANTQNFAQLSDVGSALQQGRLLPGPKGLAVQKVQWSQTRDLQAMQKTRANTYAKAAAVVAVAGTALSGFLGTIGSIASLAASGWLAVKWYQAYQASKQQPQAQFAVVEAGRVKPGPMGTLAYEAIDNASMLNVVPGHPFKFAAPVPLNQVQS